MIKQKTSTQKIVLTTYVNLIEHDAKIFKKFDKELKKYKKKLEEIKNMLNRKNFQK